MFRCGCSDALGCQIMEVAWKEMEEALSYLIDMFSDLRSSLEYVTKVVSQFFVYLKFYCSSFDMVISSS